MDISATNETTTPKKTVRRVAIRWAKSALRIYFGVVLIMWLFENWLVFRPTKAEEGWSEARAVGIEDVKISSPSGTAIHAWWFERSATAPVLIICHGNGGNLSFYGPMIPFVADTLGVSVLAFDYPGYGKSEGKANEATCYDSAEGAIRWLMDTKKIPAERMVLYGESLGAGVATEMARRYPCRALVLVRPFTSLPAAAKWHYPWLPTYLLMSNRFNNCDKIASVCVPVAVMGTLSIV